MGKFEEGGPAAFREWSVVIHDQIIDSLPQTVEVDDQGMHANQQLPPVKILKWDPGNFFIEIFLVCIKISNAYSESTYNATVTNGIFKPSGMLAYARASTVMSTQSTTDFEWSVELFGPFFGIGIASELDPGAFICHHDEEAILLDVGNAISRGMIEIHSGLENLQTEDVIHFKFQPGTKKFVIEWVSNINSSLSFFR